MNEKPQVKLAETVVLIDAAYLNLVIIDMQGYFENILHRPLQEIDLAQLALYLTLDAGLTKGENEVQFLFVYDKEGARIVNCQPSDFKNELNNVAFKSSYGEFFFATVCTEDVVTREDLFLDLLALVTDSPDVKRVIAVPFNEDYGERVIEALKAVEGKEITQLMMVEPKLPLPYKWDMLAFPVMQALGIKADELG